ncbi:MAG: addiction module antidote protein, HigA family [Legionellales bacterium]|nr:addiction module antidote protein, HigA family [Legionellales bacterium]|tara:strand:- start:61007 stop:61303 length:297 start_codon:yes stop_codon:yes gene_type:complete
MTNKMRAILPGEILRDELDELDLSANAFAKKLHVPVNRITAILNGQRAITADTALRLATYFGTTPEFWLNLQTAFDLKNAIAASGKIIEKEVEHRDAA